MTEATETETAVETTVETTDVTPEVTEVATPREPVIIDRPIQTVGRRKEAVVRVRLVPGTGQFNLDGRTLENYFPNKVHQQLIKAPLVTVDRVDAFDIYAHLDGISFGELFARTCNDSPASAEIYREAVGALLQEKDVEVVSPDGVVRRSAAQIHDKDQIIPPRQRKLFV